MSPEIINGKVRRRYLDCIWRKSLAQLNRSRYTKQCHFCNRLMNKPKSDFCRNRISDNSDNPRQLWNCINRTLHRMASVSLPANNSTNSLCNSFPRHFKDKIPKFMLLSQIVIPVIILIFQLYITLAQCLKQHHLLKFLN